MPIPFTTTPDATAAPTYLMVADADALAATLPASLLAHYGAALAGPKLAALQQATVDVDRGLRYQGRKYDFNQALEFPRVLYDSTGRVRPLSGLAIVYPPLPTDVCADYNFTTQTASVPVTVQQACLYQASWILGGGDPRLDDIHAGLRSQQNSGLAESYSPNAPGADTGLCRRAYLLLTRYQLVSGRFT